MKTTTKMGADSISSNSFPFVVGGPFFPSGPSFARDVYFLSMFFFFWGHDRTMWYTHFLPYEWGVASLSPC